MTKIALIDDDLDYCNSFSRLFRREEEVEVITFSKKRDIEDVEKFKDFDIIYVDDDIKWGSGEKIIDKLRLCLDPELGINIVDLGLVYSVNIEMSKVHVLMTLTTPGCPLDSYFVKDITSPYEFVVGRHISRSADLYFQSARSPVHISITL